MSGDLHIRITKNDKQEYARLVRNTKAKINRTAKNYGVDLSDKVKIPNLEDFETRKDFNDFKDKQRSFTNRSNQHYQFKKNDYGVVASKKDISDVEYNTKKAQRIADKLGKEAANKPFISGGKEQGTVGQRMKQMGKPETAGISKPPDFDFDKIRSQKQFEDKKRNMQERSNEEFFDKRMEAMKKNLIQLLEQTFNSDADELIKKLKGVPPDDFYEMYLMFDELKFEYIYTTESDGSESNNVVSQLNSYVDIYYEGKINMDLKGF